MEKNKSFAVICLRSFMHDMLLRNSSGYILDENRYLLKYSLIDSIDRISILYS